MNDKRYLILVAALWVAGLAILLFVGWAEGCL